MERFAKRMKASVASLALTAGLCPILAFAPTALADDGAPMYRLYNPNSGEHFYTANVAERDGLINEGWHFEGLGWTAPASSDAPVYRLYNPNAGDHHYTLDVVERDMLKNAGWNDEGVGWYSNDAHGKALLRQYNPNAAAGSHNFTTSQEENDSLVSSGWQPEGVGWYGMSTDVSILPYSNPTTAVSVSLDPPTYGALVGTLTKRGAILPKVDAYYEIQFDVPVTFSVLVGMRKGTYGLSAVQIHWQDSGYNGGDYYEVNRSKSSYLDTLLGKRVIAFGRLVGDAGSFAYGTDVVMQGSDVYLHP